MGVRFNGQLGGKVTVKSDTWTMVSGTVDLTAGQTVTLGIHQFDYSAENAPDIVVDDFCFAELTVTNLLENKNYSFESWSYKVFSGYVIDTWSISSANYERSQEKQHGTYSAKVTNRTECWSGPNLSASASEFYFGEGVYYYSYYAKCVNANDTCNLVPQIVVKNADFANTEDGRKNGLWKSGSVCSVTGSAWTKVEGFISLPEKVNDKTITDVTLQISQPADETAICAGIYFDNFTFAKPTGYSIGTNLLSEANALLGSKTNRTDVTASTGDYFMFVSNRTVSYGLPVVDSVYGKMILDEQGTGQYTFSFDVKCLFPTDSTKIAGTIEIKANEKNSEGNVYAEPLSGTYVTVTGSDWQTVTATINVPENVKGLYEIEQIGFRPSNSNFDASNPTELLFDNFCLTKSDYVDGTEGMVTEFAERKPYSEVKRSSRTGIGAVYYQMWFESLDEWWTLDTEEAFWKYASVENDCNSTQEARSLSVVDYQFHLPFFATINKSITQSQVGNAVRGDVSNGVAEFGAFTQEIWTQEMEYAIDAGIDFMAYLWAHNNRPENTYESAYQYHIKTRGLNNRIKMCAILQGEDRDIDAMVNAMTENYWYTIDGMPVVYIYGGNKVATEMFVNLIRRKLAVAQKVKYGAIGMPAYIIVMGNNNLESAQEAEALNVDATGWYGTGAGYSAALESEKTTKNMPQLKGVNDAAEKPTSITEVAFSATARNNLQIIDRVAPITENGNISVTPIITLGYNTEPRILNPVHWNFSASGIAERAELSKQKLSNSAISGKLPTPEEMTEHVLNVLNKNKENASSFNANTVLIYAWNEFNEGGWFCPNLKFDSDGNVVEGEVNREYLDAVKRGIALYREHEAENATYDVNGNVVTENIDIPVYNDNKVKINVKGSIDAIDLNSVTITANGKKVTPVLDMQAETLICNVENNSQVSVSFSKMGVYTPVSIQYAGVKGSILGINEYSFTAYGNYTELDVKYEEIEGELKTVTMFYVNASGKRVVFDNFVVGGDVVEKINNYPKLYQKKFKAFYVDGVLCKNAEEAAMLIEGAQTEIEVEYVDSASASIIGYHIVKHENMSVTVNGTEAPEKVEPFALATFTAEEQKDGESFSYWEDENGQIISYNRVYMRYITGDVDISPVYGKAIRPVAVTVKVADNTDKLVLIAERSLSDDCQILEHGIILAEYNTGNLELSSVGENSQGKVYLGHRVNNGENVLNNGTYILTKGDKHSHGGTYSDQGTLLSFVAFVRYVDADGREYVEYSPIGKSNVVKAELDPSLDFDEID